MSRFDLGRIALAVSAVALLAGLVIFLGLRTPPAPPINGDQLGQDTGESFSAYQQRADASLEMLDDASPAPSYALVVFARPLTPDEAAAVVEPADRVNAMMVASAPPRSLPEPVAGEDRADVFARELDRIAASLQGLGDVPVPERFDSVVVHDAPAVLHELRDHPDVAAVEALPPDAVWGLFGIRTVDVAAEQPAAV